MISSFFLSGFVADIQSEGWLVAGAGDFNRQNGLAFFTEKGIDSLQENGFETSRGFRKFRIQQQLSMKIEVLVFQSVSSSQMHSGSLHIKGQPWKSNDGVPQNEMSLELRNRAAGFFIFWFTLTAAAQSPYFFADFWTGENGIG